MLLAQVVTNIDWNVYYNSIVLSIIAISQIYLDFAIIASQRRQARERKLVLAKEKAEAEAALKQASRDSTI
jgi:hypothetical protein